MSSKTQENKTSSRFRTLVCMLFCIFVLILSLIFISNQTAAYNDLRLRNDSIQQDLAREEAIFADLYYQLTNFDSDAYIEALARERFGWVRGNEMVLRMITD